MVTIEYRLKSNRELSVRVPEDYASNAEAFVKLVLEKKKDVVEAASQHPYLRNTTILSRTLLLASNSSRRLASWADIQKAFMLGDELYLSVCQYDNKTRMVNEPENTEASELDKTLLKIIKYLEQGRVNLNPK